MKPQVKIDMMKAVQRYTYTEYLGEYVAGRTPNGPEGFADYPTFRKQKEELIAALQCDDQRAREVLERQLMLV